MNSGLAPTNQSSSMFCARAPSPQQGEKPTLYPKGSDSRTTQPLRTQNKGGEGSVLREQNKKGEEHLQLPFSTRERPLIQSPTLGIIACSQGDNQNLEDAIKAKGRRNTPASSPTNKTTMYRYTRCLTIHTSGIRHTIPSSKRELSPPLRAPHSISPRLHLGREQNATPEGDGKRGGSFCFYAFKHNHKCNQKATHSPFFIHI